MHKKWNYEIINYEIACSALIEFWDKKLSHDIELHLTFIL
jgi:hypothetical protein